MNSAVRQRFACLGIAVATLFGGVLHAELPTVEERVAASGLNPEYFTWTPASIRLWPPPSRTNLPPPQVCYRYDFELPAAPRFAALSMIRGGDVPFAFKVNGQAVIEPMPGRMGSVHKLDLTDLLQAGHNVLTFRSMEQKKRMNAWLRAEGVVFCQDGSSFRLTTGEAWRAGWDLTGDWAEPGASPTNMVPVEVLTARVKRIDAPAYQPYHGPVMVAPARGGQKPDWTELPIFDDDEQVDLYITVMNGRSSVVGNRAATNPVPATALTLSCSILDEHTREQLGTSTVALAPRGSLDLAGRLKTGPLPQGVYRFRFTLKADGAVVDRRDVEVACVGVFEQPLVDGSSYTDGMELKQVVTIDCTAEPDPEAFIALTHRGDAIETVVKEGAAGRYRTFAEDVHYRNFAYRFKVRNLFVPHLAVIEWPDDADRGILVQVYEGSTMVPYRYKIARPGFRGGFQRGETSIVCTEEHPRRTNKMQKLYIIYWPNEEEESIHVWNTAGGSAPAAASRITIYEIVNGLPALRIRDAGDRMIGYHTERGPATMSASYYAGPLGAMFPYAFAGVEHPEWMRNWYTTTANMIQRMRFSGQNLYLMGHFMYTGTLYPTRHFTFAQNRYSAGDANVDYVSLMLRMFERHELSMVSGIEYVNTPDVLEAASAVSLEDVVNKGAPTLFTMNKDASLSALHGGSAWKGLNYFHPRVQESILTIVDELIELYAGYPAWKGVGFILSRNFGPMTVANAKHDHALNYGYEDYTVNLFEKQTGIRVPVEPLDPKRFRKRYDWLLANAKQEWIDWRCAQFTKLFCRFRDRLVKARPDLTLYLMNFEPMNFTDEAAQVVGHYDDADAMAAVVKLFGFDVRALRKENNIVVSYSYPSPGTGVGVGARQRVYRDLAHSQPWHDLFANDGKGGAYIWSGIPHYGPRYPEDTWIFEWPVVRQGYFWPRYFSDTFVKVLCRSNPTWMPHTWMDVAESSGRLHDLRLFSRLYRSLPNGEYERLTGNGLDKNLWVSVMRAGRTVYGYAANQHWWDLDVSLEFKQGKPVFDLVTGEDVPLEQGMWSFTLGPYEVRPFRLDRGFFRWGDAVRGAETVIRNGPAEEIADALSESRDVVDRVRARMSDIRDLPGWDAVPVLAALVERADALRDAGDLDEAYELTSSWQLEHARNRVVNEAMEAIPFIVLGPFGEEQHTAAPPESYYEVVPAYKGLETPFLGEFTGAGGKKLPDLASGFRPDPGAIYKVYPGTQATWQMTAKTDYLSFYGLCHSAHPFWMIGYAYTEVYSPEAQDVMIRAGSDHALAIWCNDKLVLQHGGHGRPRGGQRPSRENQNRGKAHLEKGWNRILIKAVQRGLAKVFFRLTDEQGKGLDDLKFRVPRGMRSGGVAE